MIKTYYPEMKEKKPENTIGDVRVAYNGYTIKTPIELKTNRSIKFVKTYKSADLVPQAQHKVGWHEYRATEKGMEALAKAHNFSMEILLD